MLAALLCPVCPPGIQQDTLAETLGIDDVASSLILSDYFVSYLVCSEPRFPMPKLG